MDMDWGSAVMGLGLGATARGAAQAKTRAKGTPKARAEPSKRAVKKLIKKPVTSRPVQKPVAYPPGAHNRFSLPSCIKVGSVCSGMGTDHWALKAIRSRNFEFEFWCECDKSAQAWLRANVDVGQEYTDLSRGFVDQAPYVDILTGGFPCQPFSLAGRHGGVTDPRGNLWKYIIAYIDNQQPRVVLLENVKGMAQKHEATLNTIVKKIEAIIDRASGEPCYDVYMKTLNSLKVGCVPQSRERIYIVAVKRMGRSSVTFEWPSDVEPLELDIIYDQPRPPFANYSNYPLDRFSPMVQAHISKALEVIKAMASDEGKPATDYGVIIDMGSSKLNMGIGYSPCLTATRCKGLSYMDLQTAKRLSCKEMMRLQGFTTDEIAFMDFSDVSNHTLGAMIGNGFTKTVVQRLLKSAMDAAEAP